MTLTPEQWALVREAVREQRIRHDGPFSLYGNSEKLAALKELEQALNAQDEPIRVPSRVQARDEKCWFPDTCEIHKRQSVTHSRYNVSPDIHEPVRTCCLPAVRMTARNQTLRHAESCPNKCPENCNLTRGHE